MAESRPVVDPEDSASIRAVVMVNAEEDENGSDPQSDRVKERDNTLQIEVDLLNKDLNADADKYKNLVWDIGAGTKPLNQLNHKRRSILFDVVAEYRKQKNDQRLKDWVETSKKLTPINGANFAAYTEKVNAKIRRDNAIEEYARAMHQAQQVLGLNSSARAHEEYVREHFADLSLEVVGN